MGNIIEVNLLQELTGRPTGRLTGIAGRITGMLTDFPGRHKRFR